MANVLAQSAMTALQQFNSDYGVGWTFGTPWTSVGTQFETFINKYLFPKINETALVDIPLGNRFDWLAKEIDFIAQYSEDYVIMDTVPINLNLSKSAELMLKQRYPRMATMLYNQGIVKKTKFTLNNNDVRFNFLTLADATTYALGVFKKTVSDIQVSEESEIKGMLVDYAINQAVHKLSVTSETDLFNSVFESLLNIQNNSSKYNEVQLASGGTIGRYTTNTQLKDAVVLTNDKMKTFLLNTQLANTFQVAGLDPTKRIISFDDLGGVFRCNENITIANQATIDAFSAMGDYQIAIGDVVPENAVLTWDVSALTEFSGNVTEIKPASDLFAFIFDVNALKYRRNTKGMLKEPFKNPEFDEVTHWLHYYSFKAISPFFNKIVIQGS